MKKILFYVLSLFASVSLYAEALPNVVFFIADDGYG